MNAADGELLDEFCDALWLEDGLARNTLESYRRDLAQLAAWLREQHGHGLGEATHADLLDYLAQRVAARARPRTTGRLLSSVKRFYRFLLRQGRIREDPSLRIDAPKLPRSLPRALSEQDVERLLAAPDVDQPLGLRDRSMLEVLYASGLRVSELVRLTVPQLSLNMGVLRVLGKGSKERLVPLGEEALAWVRRYLAEGRPEILRGRAA
ncbi:MAG TPA: tyrosine-type recombinase/integrase, partial [Burkholderiales bacterium]|nr:tyrosine-type recombinase/integrase [Burkholderiales bacterium]